MSEETAVIEAPPEGEFKKLLSDFVALEHLRREHEDALEVINKKLEKLSVILIEQFADLGMQNARVDGLTVYIKMNHYVSKRGDVSTQAVCDELTKCGLGYLVSDGYNAQSLKSKIREYQDQEIEIPPSLAELLNIGEVPKLATRK